ncbi:ATP-binding cassette domain-containing protein [Acholeplasma equirhinis]|uniref:ABC transporter ATP-binding protein n=1 Tax=Acholeplasma equirhinis TaxID=555393 RepID=UPI00197AC9E0|nr:ATP-binding cassette domain-containing protein [Acholeplasma equirhinis]MBN3490661.1 ATP-binding cassette domain-containing protein [Acholeplasma equirhinis]
MLEVKNVTLKYGDFVAVDDLSFEVNKGEIFGLLGTNGAGKTTTFRTIMGLLYPSKGYVKYDGKFVSYDTVDKIGYMIEERSLLTKLTVKDLMLYFGQLKNVPVQTILERLDYWLKRFDIESYKNKKIKELSKGNQQKIQFISALINEPSLLVLDEPFSGLDVINMELFVGVIKEYQKKGCTIIFSSHQIDHVESFCERLVILQKGKMVLSGIIKEIKKQFKKQTISIIADGVDAGRLREISGVYDVIENANEWIVRVESEENAKAVFDYIKTLEHVRRFDVDEATLEEIFIAKVGKKYEEA